MAEGTRKKPKGGRKNRKWGRNKDWCKAYAARGQREKNKVVRLRKHLKSNPNDPVARALVEKGGRRKAAL